MDLMKMQSKGGTLKRNDLKFQEIVCDNHIGEEFSSLSLHETMYDNEHSCSALDTSGLVREIATLLAKKKRKQKILSTGSRSENNNGRQVQTNFENICEKMADFIDNTTSTDSVTAHKISTELLAIDIRRLLDDVIARDKETKLKRKQRRCARNHPKILNLQILDYFALRGKPRRSNNEATEINTSSSNQAPRMPHRSTYTGVAAEQCYEDVDASDAAISPIQQLHRNPNFEKSPVSSYPAPSLPRRRISNTMLMEDDSEALTYMSDTQKSTDESTASLLGFAFHALPKRNVSSAWTA